MKKLLILLTLLSLNHIIMSAGVVEKSDYLIRTDGSQYPWVTEKYRWGNGQAIVNGELVEFSPNMLQSNGLFVEMRQKVVGDDIIETFTFRNKGRATLRLADIEIYTPFNDNYPEAVTCLKERFHAHVWAAGTAGYVNAMRMGSKAPHFGLMMVQGGLDGYSIHERDAKKGSSNFRGVIALGITPDGIPGHNSITLKKGQSFSFSWRIFEHQGWEDFYDKMVGYSGMHVSADQYVGEKGNTLTYTVRTRKGTATYEYTINQSGDIRIPVKHNKGETYLEFFGTDNIMDMVNRRADFILANQVYHAKDGDEAGRKRDGAILPYDNATEQIYCNWEKERNWSDANEGRERIGAATFLAYLALTKKDAPNDSLTTMLKQYASFVRHQLQDEDFRMWTDADKGTSRSGQKTRYYNYPWAAHLYCTMAMLTGERQYAEWAYGTIRKCYATGGYAFYYIDMPVRESIDIVGKMCSKAMADTLISEYCRQAEQYMKTGLRFPKSEVNYEQSIVAPSVNFLCELAIVLKEQQGASSLLTRIEQYVKETMPVVEVFGGRQPSSHLNDISIRHWDGYWFGMPKQWGDTFPHYWSCISGECFMHYYLLTGNEAYKHRAFNIFLQNMSLFTQDGRGGAAFIYPTRVNSKPSHGLNAFANDQDTALMYLLKWMLAKRKDEYKSK